MAATPLRADSRSTFARRVLVRARELGLTKKALAARAQISRQALDNLLAQGAQARDDAAVVIVAARDSVERRRDQQMHCHEAGAPS